MSGPGNHDFEQFVKQATGSSGARLGPVIAGGNSNVTRLVECEGRRWILRHPPANLVSGRAAAGIEREFAALRALHSCAPVPEPIAWCADPSILGVPFSLVRFVEGITIRERLPAAYGPGTDAVNATGEALIEALAIVHRTDPTRLLAAGLGRPDGFVERQIDRWLRIRADTKVRDLPQIERIAAWLVAHAPPPLPGRIVHCDYHIDNCLSDPGKPGIRAIIDWEMVSVADPRVDLGLALFFWKREPSAVLGLHWLQQFSNRPDVISREALAHSWSAISGLPVDDLTYFVAFAAWRLAAIIEGAYVLFRQGKVDSAYARSLEQDVPALLHETEAVIAREAA